MIRKSIGRESGAVEISRFWVPDRKKKPPVGKNRRRDAKPEMKELAREFNKRALERCINASFCSANDVRVVTIRYDS